MSASTITTIIQQNPEFVERCIAALNKAEHYLSPLYRPDPTNDPHRHSHDLKDMHEHAAVLNSFIEMASSRIHKIELKKQLDNIINGTVRARTVTFASKLPRKKGIASDQMLQERRRQLDSIAEMQINTINSGRGHKLVDNQLKRNVDAVVALLTELSELIDATKPNLAHQPATFDDEWDNAPQVTEPLVPIRKLTDEERAQLPRPKVHVLRHTPALRDLRAAASAQ